MDLGGGDDARLQANKRIQELESTVAALQEKIKVVEAKNSKLVARVSNLEESLKRNQPLPKVSADFEASIEVQETVAGDKSCQNTVWTPNSEPLTLDNTGSKVEMDKPFGNEADERLNNTPLSDGHHTKEHGLENAPQEPCVVQNEPTSRLQLGLQNHGSASSAIEGGAPQSQVGQVSRMLKKGSLSGQHQEPERIISILGEERQQIVARSGNKTCGSQNHVFGKQVLKNKSGSDEPGNQPWPDIVVLFCSYHGFASQGASKKTVESTLFAALEHTKLLIGERAEAKYSRCGRTDKGVSAIGQLIALELRSKLKPPPAQERDVDLLNHDVNDLDAGGSGRDRVAAARASRHLEESVSSAIGAEDEIDYVGVLNRVLPDDIRVLGWCPVPQDFNARFSCLYREYKYFFINTELDIDAMKVAGAKFLGEHDFRNFCKMDAANVHNYTRAISNFDILPANQSWAGRQVWMMKIRGTAFLWHQIRCMAAVLFMVGHREESPSIVEELLNVGEVPRKPQYILASESPLVLHTCGFQGLTLHCASRAAKHLQMHLNNLIEQAIIQLALLQEAMSELPISDMKEDSSLKKPHAPLLGRLTEPSYEERRGKKTLTPF